MELDESNAKVDGVRVAVRVRPLNARERGRAADSQLGWRIDEHELAQTASGRPVQANSFAFDHVFGEKADNATVFESLARPVVGAALEGYNATIFAYGQTSSGKTHSMLGSDADPGVTRRSIQAVFESISQTRDREFLLRASYIEIYQEIIRDLLEPSHDNLKIHEDLNRRVYVEAREEVVSSVDEVMRMIADGETVRAVGETNMNDRSSRSHTIFRLIIESRATDAYEAEDGDDAEPRDDGVAVRASTLSLVDLAGSERADLTGAEGVRLKEGSHINKSLLTLGNVINKLSSSEPGATAHIPYRDSKLTRILQPALGGNARTAILCAITPAVMHMEETLSTLKFASRAKKVKNRTQCNEYLNDTAKLRRCERELAQLKKLLEDGQAGGAEGAANSVAVSAEERERGVEKRIKAFSQKFESMLKQVQKQSPMKPNSRERCGSRRARPASHSFRQVLDLQVPAKRRRLSCEVGENSPSASQDNSARPMDETSQATERQLADLRKSVFAADQAKARMQAEIDFERKALASEVQTLAEVAEEANRSRYAAEDECQDAVSALAQAQTAALVSEMISVAMVSSEANKDVQEAQARFVHLSNVEQKASETSKKAANLERELSEAKKREKRGVGPVLREVSTLQSKLADMDSKLKSAKQASSKSLSEKAAVEKDIISKDRQLRVLDAELQKYRKHESMSNARAEKELAAEKEKAEQSKKELDEVIGSLRKELSALKQECDDLNGKVLTATKVEEDLSAQVTSKSSDLADKTNALNATEEALARKVALCEELESQVSRANDTLQSRTSNFSKGVRIANMALGKRSQDLRSCEVERDELGSQLARLHLEKEELRAELSENQNTLGDAQQKVASLKESLDTIALEKEALLETQVSQAATLAEEQKTRQEVQNNHDSIEEDLKSLRKNLEAVEAERDESSANLRALTQSSEELLAKAKMDIENLTGELSSAKQSTEDTIRARNEAASNYAASQRVSEEILDAATTSVAKLKCDLEKSEKLLEQTRSDNNDAEAARKELLEKKESLLLQEKEDSDNARASLSKVRNELERVCEERDQSLQLMTNMSNVSEKGLEKAKREITKLKGDLRASEDECDSLRAKQGSLSQKHAQMTQTRDTLNSEVVHLQGLLEAKEAAHAQLASKNASLQGQSDEAKLDSKKELETLNERLAEMRRVHRMAGDELKLQKEEVRAAREHLEQENERLSNEVEKSSRKGVALLEKVYSRDSKVSELEEKLAEYRRSGGAIRRLEQKLQRRDAMVEEQRRVLDEQCKLISKGGLAEQWSVAERASRAEAIVDQLRAQVSKQEQDAARLEERERAGQEERLMLRKEIKARDVVREKARSDKLCRSLRGRENEPVRNE